MLTCHSVVCCCLLAQERFNSASHLQKWTARCMVCSAQPQQDTHWTHLRSGVAWAWRTIPAQTLRSKRVHAVQQPPQHSDNIQQRAHFNEAMPVEGSQRIVRSLTISLSRFCNDPWYLPCALHAGAAELFRTLNFITAFVVSSCITLLCLMTSAVYYAS